MRPLRSLDPLVLFVLIGSALVALQHFAGPTSTSSANDRRIVVTDADVTFLVEGFQKRRFRPPTPNELAALIHRNVTEEVLYREAVAIGLDREDPALRQRLARKLESLARNVGATEPTEAELEAHLVAHADKYAEETQRSFEHVYVSEDKRRASADAYARKLLAGLRQEPDQDLDAIGGDVLDLRARQPLQTPRDVRAQFGLEFTETLFRLDVGPWQGPIRSGFGLHVVRVRETRHAEPPRLEEVRERVRTDFVYQRKEAALEAYLKPLLEKYVVELPATVRTEEEEAR